jgi:hypothetical protein
MIFTCSLGVGDSLKDSSVKEVNKVMQLKGHKVMIRSCVHFCGEGRLRARETDDGFLLFRVPLLVCALLQILSKLLLHPRMVPFEFGTLMV